MAHKKVSRSKIKKTKTEEKEVDQDTESEMPEIEEGPKSKKSIDLESALEPANIVEEKTDEDVAVGVDDLEETTSDDLSLDDDELNPFGDKWEQ